MILLSDAPPAKDDLANFYARMPVEGMVQSSLMHGETFEQSDAFDEDWACPALTWSAGGEESYEFRDGRTVRIRHSGAMTIAAGERYAYAAGASPFYSNMIVFPKFVTDFYQDAAPLKTRLVRPDRETEGLMAAIASNCRTGNDDTLWFHEKLHLLYGKLNETQQEIDAAPGNINALKQKTQSGLAARADRAQQFILNNFDDPSLRIATIAREACISPFHLIRVFKSLTGKTPAQYLKAARMTAAGRMLRDTDLGVTDIATHSGYTDRTAFCRAFHHYFGVSPSAYRAHGGN